MGIDLGEFEKGTDMTADHLEQMRDDDLNDIIGNHILRSYPDQVFSVYEIHTMVTEMGQKASRQDIVVELIKLVKEGTVEVRRVAQKNKRPRMYYKLRK